MKNLTEIHAASFTIFLNELFPEEQEGVEAGAQIVCGPSRACSMYNKMIEGEDVKDGEADNCIGENFNQLLHRLRHNWFESYKPTDDLDYYFFNYILLLYLFVERVDIIFDIINPGSKSKLFNDFQNNNMKTLRVINKWANFVKHPKEFLFTHWPVYYIEGTDAIEIKGGDVKVDTEFILKHYFSEKQPRPVILENNNKVFVEIPDLENLTKKFCDEMNTFFDFICCNQIVADFLKKKSTIVNYFTPALPTNESLISDNKIPVEDELIVVHTQAGKDSKSISMVVEMEEKPSDN